MSSRLSARGPGGRGTGLAERALRVANALIAHTQSRRHIRPFAAVLLTVAAATLAGCGFRPLYGESSAGSPETLAQIGVNRIADRPGQMLRNMLIYRLTPQGQPASPLYTLDVSLTETVYDLAVRRDESATRANLTMTAAFRLMPAQTPGARAEPGAQPLRPLLAGTISSTNSYNRLRSEYATLAAREDARERALQHLAEEIRLRIAIALENPPPVDTVPEPPPVAPPSVPEFGRRGIQ